MSGSRLCYGGTGLGDGGTRTAGHTQMIPYGRPIKGAETVKLRWLGWAGVEIDSEGATVVVDPLADAGATFAALGDRAAAVELPELVEPTRGAAVAGLVTHLHRDHTDAAALAGSLAEGAAVHEPEGFGGDADENVALAQAVAELERAGLERRPVQAWKSVEAGPFTLTALPAVD